MTNKMLKNFALLALLAFPVLGQNSQEHLVCKRISRNESGSFVTQDEQSVTHSRRIQGIPGKRGATGVKGDRGVPGVKGEPGSSAIVEYEMIFEAINETIRRELTELKLKLEMLQNNVRELSKTPEQRCNEKSGLFYEGKCYFVPYISYSYSSRINYDVAVQKCNNEGSTIAEIHSQNQQETLENFFRSKIPLSWDFINFHLGMSYSQSGRNLRFKDKKEVSMHQFKWVYGYPSGSGDKISIEIWKNGPYASEGFFNRDASETGHGVICESATGGILLSL